MKQILAKLPIVVVFHGCRSHGGVAIVARGSSRCLLSERWRGQRVVSGAPIIRFLDIASFLVVFETVRSAVVLAAWIVGYRLASLEILDVDVGRVGVLLL